MHHSGSEAAVILGVASRRCSSRPHSKFVPSRGSNGALLAGGLHVRPPPVSEAAAQGGHALRRRYWRCRRVALSPALCNALSVVAEGPGEVRVPRRELLASAIQRRRSSRPRRSSPPSNLCRVRARVDASVATLPSFALRVDDGRGGDEVRQVEPGGRSQPGRNILLLCMTVPDSLARRRNWRITSGCILPSGDGAQVDPAGARVQWRSADAAMGARRGARR